MNDLDDKPLFKKFIHRLNEVLENSFNVNAVLKGIARLAMETLEVERCSLMLLEKNKLYLKVASWNNFEPVEDVIINIGEGISGKVAQLKKPILIENIEKSQFKKKNEKKYKNNSFLSVPLLVGTECFGVLNVNNKKNGEKFNETDRNILSILASNAALIIKNSLLINRIKSFQEELRTIFQFLPIGVIAITKENVISFFNLEAEKILEKNLKVNVKMYDVLPKSITQKIEKFLLLYAEKNDVVSLTETTEIAVQNNKIKPIKIIINPYIYNDTLNGVILSIVDLSISYEYEKLKEIEEMRLNFISMVSHELRTPLTSIKGAVHILKMFLGTIRIPDKMNGRFASMLSIIDRNCERLTTLINDLLNISLIQKDELAIEPSYCDIVPIIQDVINTLKTVAERKKISLKFEYDKNIPPLYVDREKISKVFSNLIENAIKFNYENGEVIVKCEYKDDEEACICSIKDSGRGIKTQNFDKVFTIFWQEDSSKTREYGGTGIGLYVAKNIVKAHKGKIWFKPNKDKGMTFYVKLYKNIPV